MKGDNSEELLAALRGSKFISVIFAAVFLVCTVASGATTLIDVAFTGGSFTGGLVTEKTGYAAIGQTSNDFWNTYVNYSGVLSNLDFVDGSASGVRLTVANTDESGRNGAIDPMYGVYVVLYVYDYVTTEPTNIAVTVTNLAAGVYDLYLYGHGPQDNQNSIFQVAVGSESYGSKATTTNGTWLSTNWQAGIQYVEFSNVVVSSGQGINIAVEPGKPGAPTIAYLAGLQMAAVASPNAFIAAQPEDQGVARGSPATFAVVADGASVMTYQWLFNNRNIPEATNSTYNIVSARPTNIGGYSVIVSNPYNSVTSAVATLTISQSLIDVAFTSIAETSKTGFAAAGVGTNDFWNSCIATALPDSSLEYGALSNMQFTDGALSGSGLTVTNVDGNDQNGASDPMYGTYLFATSNNISLTVTNLRQGAYDFYIYGHGKEDIENSAFQLSVGPQSYGIQATTNGFGWLSPVWQHGLQFVEFTNVSVPAGEMVTITVEPGADPLYSSLSGLQILWHSSPFIVTQPANQLVQQGASISFSVEAGGHSPLSYQWLFNSNNIPGATNDSYGVNNVQYTNAGSYSVVVSNSYGSITANPAVLTFLAPPFTNGSFEVPVVTINNVNNWLAANPGDTWLAGWTIGVSSVEIDNGPDPALLRPFDGQQQVVFNSYYGPPGETLSQAFRTILGETYLVTYSEAPLIPYSYTGVPVTATVSEVGGGLLASNGIFYSYPYNREWLTTRFTFVSPSDSALLTFTYNSVPPISSIVELDAVSVTPLPTNTPPLMIGISNQFVNVKEASIITNYAFSASGPIAFALASNAPIGAEITSNGVFTWAPVCEQGGTTNLITVWATDSGTPPMSNSMTFEIVVGQCVEVEIGSSVLQAGQSTCLPVTLITTIGLSNLNFTLDSTTGFITNWSISSTNPNVGSATVSMANSSQPQFSFEALGNQTLQGASVIGSICLDTLSGASGFVPLKVSDLTAVAASISPATNLIGESGRVVVIGPQALLELSLSTNSSPTLTLFGKTGATYDLLSTKNLLDASLWTPVGNVTLTDLFQVITLGCTTNQMQFYKAVQP